MRKFENVMQAITAMEEKATEEGMSYTEYEKKMMDGFDVFWEAPELSALRWKYFPAGKPTAPEILVRLSQALHDAHLEFVVPFLYWYLKIKTFFGRWQESFHKEGHKEE